MKHLKKFNESNKPEIHNIKVKSWKITDKFNCPKCGEKISMNSKQDYICEPCNIQVQPIMNF